MYNLACQSTFHVPSLPVFLLLLTPLFGRTPAEAALVKPGLSLLPVLVVFFGDPRKPKGPLEPLDGLGLTGRDIEPHERTHTYRMSQNPNVPTRYSTPRRA